MSDRFTELQTDPYTVKLEVKLVKMDKEIAKKDALIAELVEALEPFATLQDQFTRPIVGLHPVFQGGKELEVGMVMLKAETLHRARTVINKAKGT